MPGLCACVRPWSKMPLSHNVVQPLPHEVYFQPRDCAAANAVKLTPWSLTRSKMVWGPIAREEFVTIMKKSCTQYHGLELIQYSLRVSPQQDDGALWSAKAASHLEEVSTMQLPLNFLCVHRMAGLQRLLEAQHKRLNAWMCHSLMYTHL